VECGDALSCRGDRRRMRFCCGWSGFVVPQGAPDAEVAPCLFAASEWNITSISQHMDRVDLQNRKRTQQFSAFLLLRRQFFPEASYLTVCLLKHHSHRFDLAIGRGSSILGVLQLALSCRYHRFIMRYVELLLKRSKFARSHARLEDCTNRIHGLGYADEQAV
jgi:hypothetical protein